MRLRLHSQLCLFSFFIFFDGFSQQYQAGHTSMVLTDSSRIYKPRTTYADELHYRSVELDFWYPTENATGRTLSFGDLFKKFEERAIRYDDTEDFTGVSEEMATLFVAELGIGMDPQKLLTIETSSFEKAKPTKTPFPLVIYMAGFNGMGFENYKVLENLAESGFVVVSIWSVGRYPGNMTNQKEDMLEQVYDAEFAIEYLRKSKIFPLDLNRIGLLGCSWGGMSAAVLANRLPGIKSMASFDGTETHYFGEKDTNLYFGSESAPDNDENIKNIHDSCLLKKTSDNFIYLYFESGDKIDGFIPTSEYHYFKKLNSEKYYLRFKSSMHSDFTCIPYILESSENSMMVYSQMNDATLDFFEYTLKDKPGFGDQWQSLLSPESTTDQPFDIAKSPKNLNLINIRGRVFDRDAKKPLQYVNVGILNQGLGTVTDEDGLFELALPEELQNDTLKISMIGYQPFQAVINTLKFQESQLKIRLEEQVEQLDEVVLSAKAFRRKVLGNKTQSKFLGAGFGHDQLGAEMGIKINIRQSVLIDTFRFFISYNRLSAQAVFRLNFYEVISGKPGSNLMRQQVLIPIEPKQTGEITVDLKPYSIVLEDDVIVSLEWVDLKGKTKEGEAIFFPLGLFGAGTLYKESSQAPFKKLKSLGVGFNLDVRF
ncbi:MAG: carboxypeptidase-like regulatory domain-containing protein [Flavobacteriaceae bacterium]